MLAAIAGGCASVGNDLERGRQHYASSQYAAALRVFLEIQQEIPALPASRQALYYYYRGMTHYRLGQRSDARYYLGQAHELVSMNPRIIGEDHRRTIEETLRVVTPERRVGEP